MKARGFDIYHGQALVSKTAPSAAVDVMLAVSGSTESVQVTADALAAETTSTQLGEMLETRKIESVPLNGRNFTDLMASIHQTVGRQAEGGSLGTSKKLGA